MLSEVSWICIDNIINILKQGGADSWLPWGSGDCLQPFTAHPSCPSEPPLWGVWSVLSVFLFCPSCVSFVWCSCSPAQPFLGSHCTLLGSSQGRPGDGGGHLGSPALLGGAQNCSVKDNVGGESEMSCLINVSVVQGLHPLGELQQISAEFAAFGKSCCELQTIHSQPKLRII